jgi:hypothetical protein
MRLWRRRRAAAAARGSGGARQRRRAAAAAGVAGSKNRSLRFQLAQQFRDALGVAAGLTWSAIPSRECS